MNHIHLRLRLSLALPGARCKCGFTLAQIICSPTSFLTCPGVIFCPYCGAQTELATGKNHDPWTIVDPENARKKITVYPGECCAEYMQATGGVLMKVRGIA